MSSERITKEDWDKLRVADLDDWTLIVAGDQHTLGSVIIFPPGNIEASIAHLPDEELIEFGKVSRIVENLLKKSFGAEWFNYSQAGNRIRKLHILIQPRYSKPFEFVNKVYVDEGWPGPIKALDEDDLPDRENVFNLVEELRNQINNIDNDGMHLNIYNN